LLHHDVQVRIVVLGRSSHGGVGVVSQVGSGGHFVLGFGSRQHQWSCAVRLQKKKYTKIMATIYDYKILSGGNLEFKNILGRLFRKPNDAIKE
jgi:hypothetical protein